MKRAKPPKGNPYVHNIKQLLAYQRKKTGNKKLTRATYHRIFLCGYRFEPSVCLQDRVPLEQAAEMLRRKPYLLFCDTYKQPQLITYAEYNKGWFELKQSRHLLAPAVASAAMTEDDAIALYLAEDNTLLIQSGDWGSMRLWFLVPQEDILKYEHGKLINA